jgi:hypothetical protein
MKSNEGLLFVLLQVNTILSSMGLRIDVVLWQCYASASHEICLTFWAAEITTLTPSIPGQPAGWLVALQTVMCTHC